MAAETMSKCLTINLTDEGRLLTLRTILGYEAGVRGLSTGQTFVELIEEAIDVDSYPEEVREQLERIRAEKIAAATRRCLDVVA